MLVRHKNPTFTGTVVLATVPFRFVSGIAETPELSASRLAVIAIKGWSVVEEDPAEEDEEVETPEPAAKRKAKAKKELELNEDVAPEDMEVPEPEIG